MRYFLQLSYKGTGYHGWQEQSNSHDTIQEICNEAVSKVLNHKVKLAGAGRTDTGVHAEQFYAHFDSTNENLVEEKHKWLYKFNSVTPFTIAFNDIFKVKPDAHARFNAIERTYRYDITLKKNPFLYGNALFLPYPVDIEKMNMAALKLHQYKEFSSFKKITKPEAVQPQTPKGALSSAINSLRRSLDSPIAQSPFRGLGRTDFCTIKSAVWKQHDNKLSFTITADRFLRNMVRAIVGTMLNVGVGKSSMEDFCRIIESKDRSKAGASVPACGLYLTSIEYPPDIFIK